MPAHVCNSESVIKCNNNNNIRLYNVNTVIIRFNQRLYSIMTIYAVISIMHTRYFEDKTNVRQHHQTSDMLTNFKIIFISYQYIAYQ